MGKLLASFVAILSISTSVAQSNFLPGYIILSGNDTVRGTIDYRNWEKNPRLITFSKTGSDPAVYTIRDLQAFGVDGADHYKKSFVSLDMNPVKISEVSQYNPNRIKKDTVFLRYLVRGSQVNLYEYVDFKQHFFIQPAGETADELIYRLSSDSISTGVVTYNDFRLQLKKMLSVRGLSYQQSMEIDKLNYKEKELVRFISEVNGVQTAYKAGEFDTKRTKPVLFAGGGIVFQNMDFDSYNQILNSLDFKNSVSFIITGGIDLFAARNLQNLVIRGEISLTQFKTKGTGESQTINPSLKQKNEYSLTQVNLTPSATVMYNFLQLQKTKIYAGITLGYNISSYPKNRLTSADPITNQVYTTDDYVELQKGWMAISGKAGVIIKSKIEACLTAHLDGSFINSNGLGESSKPVSLRIFYRFR